MRAIVRLGWFLLLSHFFTGCTPLTRTKAYKVNEKSLLQQCNSIPKILSPDKIFAKALPSATFQNVLTATTFLPPKHAMASPLLLTSSKQAPPPSRTTPPKQMKDVDTDKKKLESQNEKKNLTTIPTAIRTRRLEPPAPLPTPIPNIAIPNLKKIARMYQKLGRRIARAGKIMMWRQRRLNKKCQGTSSKSGCRTWKRSATMFAANYQTSAKNYRGYMMFHQKNKHKIPKHLMKWYTRLVSQRYRKDQPNSRCYLERGMSSNCMSFSMCSQKAGLRRFRGKWGRGFHFPLWGFINYWLTETYHKFQKDYTKNGERHMGIRSLLKAFPTMEFELKKKRSYTLLNDMLKDYSKRMRRRIHRKQNIIIFKKAFCSNIVVSLGTFKRTLPGDMFVMAFPQKRSRKHKKIRNFRFQHWGLIINPKKLKILHNQTPGGLWGTSYRRWGLQYDQLAKSDLLRLKWKWNRGRRRYEQRIYFVHRLNAHYFIYARRKKAKIYETENPDLCHHWIRDHSALYFADMTSK